MITNSHELRHHPFYKISRCKACGLRQGATQVVVGDGPDNAKVMLIGEAPGYNEDKQGHPFVGDTGSYMFSVFEYHGMPREKIYTSNIVKCRPPDNRDPYPEEIKACSRNLELQLRHIQPRVIVTVGRFAMEYFLGSGKKISEVHGQTFERGGKIIYPILHPSYIMRNGNKLKPIFEEDIKKLRELLIELKKPVKLFQREE